MTGTTDHPAPREGSVLADVSQLLQGATPPEWTTQTEDDGPDLTICSATIKPTYTVSRTVRKKLVTEEWAASVYAERAANGDTRIMLDGIPSAGHDDGMTVGEAKKLIGALAQVVAAEMDAAG